MHLIIAEKNIAAQRIAGFLAEDQKVKTEKDGGVNLYHFNDSVSIGLRGHVVEIDFEPGYSNWRSEVHTPRTLIDAGIIKKPTEKKIVNLIKKLSKKADLVTIATDYDREGELIGKEAYEIVRSANKSVRINRAIFSAITKQEIKSAFENPTEIDFNLAEAGETRQEIDLVWGASLTRFISIAAKRGGNNILSVGRVQSPTLAMIVDREKEIEAFIPEPYWMLGLISEKNNEIFEARHTSGKFWNFDEAKLAESNTKEPLLVTEVKKGTKNDHSPTPFDTTAFIVAASRLGLSAANAMRIAEELYMNGFISYPRTDNTIYPASLDLDAILTELKNSPFKNEVEWVIANKREKPTQGKKSSTDHPPIHPAGAAKPEQMDEQTWKVYELVVRRFLATLSPDARWKTLKYLFNAGTEPYTSTGQKLEYEGYRHVYTYSQAKEQELPELSTGDSLPVKEIVLEEKETLPPPRYSQSKLIQQMEELGLGTKSTRHDVIGKLVSRRYVEGTPLKPTLVGRAVTETLEQYAGLITKPDMTQTIESHMEDIKKGSMRKTSVVNESKGMLHRIFDDLEQNEENIGNDIMDRTAEERMIGKCPVCGNSLMIRKSKGMAQFIGCNGYPDCSFNIGLPSAQWGNAIREEKVCDIHGLRYIKLIRKGARPWDIGCPLCNHINSNLEALRMMPSMNDVLIANLHSENIYSVYEIATLDINDLIRRTKISEAEITKIRAEAEEVLEILRKRSEMRKFVRKVIPPRRGRSHAKVVNAFIDDGINEIGDIASSDRKKLQTLFVSEQEAESLINEAKAIYNKAILKEYGVPAVSLKKYMESGFLSPEDFCFIHPAYLSHKTGINIDTVHKHVTKVCEGKKVSVPEKISKKSFEEGKKELLQIAGIGEALLEKLYMAGITNKKSLKNADPAILSKKTGISKEKLEQLQNKS
ncbi:DNA topoisomerase I [Methanoplanus sp. FWC-SCC4]|uniref:DNA topoisomerase 1 n=1 Tax=Methanochimaera problematica TaxID=2609417 RepID=A0AA97FCT3_9EURY|nr:DNA topoisomerase I [Methanoplanus sp. FWC-SCC4]WOF15683.1 DNA topoisomerase I [Methanoplanus sp. FWC-SCC4]